MVQMRMQTSNSEDTLFSYFSLVYFIKIIPFELWTEIDTMTKKKTD